MTIDPAFGEGDGRSLQKEGLESKLKIENWEPRLLHAPYSTTICKRMPNDVSGKAGWVKLRNLDGSLGGGIKLQFRESEQKKEVTMGSHRLQWKRLRSKHPTLFMSRSVLGRKQEPQLQCTLKYSYSCSSIARKQRRFKRLFQVLC